MSKFHKHHYYLVCGEVKFAKPATDDQPETIGSTLLNAVVSRDEKTFPVSAIGRAQQALQLNFHGRMEDPSIIVADVVLVNVVYLGHMSQAEFQKQPEGTKLQERPPYDLSQLN